MATIIAGNFATSAQADKAAKALRGAGFPVADIAVCPNEWRAGLFGGALMGLGGRAPRQLARPAGTLVAVKLSDPAEQSLAMASLREHDPMEIEEAEGKWKNGQWADFDPVSEPRLIWSGGL